MKIMQKPTRRSIIATATTVPLASVATHALASGTLGALSLSAPTTPDRPYPIPKGKDFYPEYDWGWTYVVIQYFDRSHPPVVFTNPGMVIQPIFEAYGSDVIEVNGNAIAVTVTTEKHGPISCISGRTPLLEYCSLDADDPHFRRYISNSETERIATIKGGVWIADNGLWLPDGPRMVNTSREETPSRT